MSALPGYILVSVLLYNSKVLLTVLIGCIAARENPVSPPLLQMCVSCAVEGMRLRLSGASPGCLL